MIKRDLRSPAVLFAIPTAIWSSTWLAIKYQLGTVAPDVSVAYRFALAALLLGAWCALRRRSLRFDRRTHAFLALQGALMFGFSYVGLYWAERYATSGLVAVVFSTIVFMNAISARWMFGSVATPRTLVAAVLGVAGVALLFAPEIAHPLAGEAGLGLLLALGATTISSAGNLAAMRNQRAGVPVMTGSAWAMAYGALAAAGSAMWHGASLRFDTGAPYVASLVYLAVFGSVVAFGAYLTLLQDVGPARASYVGVAAPVGAMLLSTVFEDYRWTVVGACGAALVLLGNGLVLAQRPSVRGAA
ncbi:MAG: DMT family transporter [Betaproteobacteria bacterium]